MRGRKPKPTLLKLIEGNRGKRRINRSEARPRLEMPSVPSHLSREAKLEWGRVCRALYDAGLLSRLDRAILAAYCTSYARWIEAERIVAEAGSLIVQTANGFNVQHPAIGISRRAAADMAKYAGELGMTPSSRSRVTAVPPPVPPNDPASKYLDRW